MILQAVEREALTRSKIMYNAILNFKQVTDYTAFLTEEGLLIYLEQERKYAITDRGIQFLTLFKETNKLLNTYDDMTANNNRRWHYINNNSNEKRIFTCGCAVEWRLDMIKFTDCLAYSKERILKS